MPGEIPTRKENIHGLLLIIMVFVLIICEVAITTNPILSAFAVLYAAGCGAHLGIYIERFRSEKKEGTDV